MERLDTRIASLYESLRQQCTCVQEEAIREHFERLYKLISQRIKNVLTIEGIQKEIIDLNESLVQMGTKMKEQAE